MSTDDWQPPPGMTKRICPRCSKAFASRGNLTCANCLAKPPRQNVTPFEPVVGSNATTSRLTRRGNAR